MEHKPEDNLRLLPEKEQKEPMVEESAVHRWDAGDGDNISAYECDDGGKPIVADFSRFAYRGEAESSPSRPLAKSCVSDHAQTAHPGGVLPPILQPGLYVVFVGYNPGLESSRLGHHYAHRSNRFYKYLFESGLIERPVSPHEDVTLPAKYGYGFSDLVSRPTRNIRELTAAERAQGVALLEERLIPTQADYICFVGKGIWETVCKVKGWPAVAITYGLQPPTQLFGGGSAFVVPSTSGLVSIPKEVQLGYWRQLKDLVDEVRPTGEFKYY